MHFEKDRFDHQADNYTDQRERRDGRFFISPPSAVIEYELYIEVASRSADT